MPGWEQRLLGAINDLKQQGGQQNIMQPGRLISIDPPIVEVCGVKIKKRIHVNPAMTQEADLGELEEAFDALATALEESKEAEEVRELVDNLAEPLQQLQRAVLALHRKSVAKPGAGVMVRQDGNDIHVMTGTGG